MGHRCRPSREEGGPEAPGDQRWRHLLVKETRNDPARRATPCPSRYQDFRSLLIGFINRFGGVSGRLGGFFLGFTILGRKTCGSCFPPLRVNSRLLPLLSVFARFGTNAMLGGVGTQGPGAYRSRPSGRIVRAVSFLSHTAPPRPFVSHQIIVSVKILLTNRRDEKNV